MMRNGKPASNTLAWRVGMTACLLSALSSQPVALQRGDPLWAHFVRAAGVVDGDRLLLILLDTDGDGRKEIFLARADTCGNAGCTWHVYSPTPVANQVRYLGKADFSPNTYRFTPGRHAFTDCWHMSAAFCALDEKHFQDGRITHRSLGMCRADAEDCQAELQRIFEWQKGEAPPVLAADVPERGRLGKVDWRQAGGLRVAPAPSAPDFNVLVVAPRPK